MSDQLPCKQCGHYAVFCDDQRDALSAQVRELREQLAASEQARQLHAQASVELTQSLSTAWEEAQKLSVLARQCNDGSHPREMVPLQDLLNFFDRALKPTRGETNG